LFLTADIRIAAADVRFRQDENTHGRFPGGDSTVRFVREAGRGNAMRYMLTGDHWSAQGTFADDDRTLSCEIAEKRQLQHLSPLKVHNPFQMKCACL
jgi:1,4-dihydroxy-2-naphthoyl-CoA synthase